jgi:hypothetical protein
MVTSGAAKTRPEGTVRGSGRSWLCNASASRAPRTGCWPYPARVGGLRAWEEEEPFGQEDVRYFSTRSRKGDPSRPHSFAPAGRAGLFDGGRE